jgi:CrcB protein
MFSFDGRELAAVFVGGALGTLARAALATLAAPDPGRWPWPTFIVNIVGAFLLGYFTTRLPRACRCRVIGAHCSAPGFAVA